MLDITLRADSSAVMKGKLRPISKAPLLAALCPTDAPKTHGFGLPCLTSMADISLGHDRI